MFFKCEMFNTDGKIIETRHIEVSVGTVDEALKHEKIIKLKNKAKDQGFGFRVKREDE
jgi:hypothetical protein